MVEDVVYAPKEGTLTVRYLDQDKDMAEIEGTGSSIGGNYGDTINYSTQPTIDELLKKGYELYLMALQAKLEKYSEMIIKDKLMM